jgi:hypothetical protein
MRLLVCRRTVWWVFKNSPVVRPHTALRCAMGLLLRESGRRKEQGSPVCSTRDQVHLSDERRLPNRGVRERLYAMAGCHAAPEGKKSFCCGYSENRCRKKLAYDLIACAGSEVALGESRLQWQSSFSQLRLSENRRKQFSSSTARHVACNVVVNAFQQYERLVNLATAKLERR